MRRIYIAWRLPGEQWFPIGFLTETAGQYAFVYTRGARQATEHGFRPLRMFPSLDEVYLSDDLFPVFANRLPVRFLRERPLVTGWLNLPPTADDLAILGRSEGLRSTDTFELFSAPEENGGRYQVECFVHGLRHRPPEAEALALTLQQGSPLVLEPEPENKSDRLAVKVLHERVHLGYVPRYLTKDMHRLLVYGDVQARVELVNRPPVPVQFRILCSLNAPWPPGFRPLQDEEFQPIVDTTAEQWVQSGQELGPASPRR